MRRRGSRSKARASFSSRPAPRPAALSPTATAPFSQQLFGEQALYDAAISNVQHGGGFLGGITTLEVPYEGCLMPLAARSQSCDLVYDANTAVLEGSFVDVVCDGVRISDVKFVLRRRDLGRIRLDTLRSNLTFRIAAIEPGVEHELAASAVDFAPLVMPLVLGVGEHRVIQVPLERIRGSCPGT